MELLLYRCLRRLAELLFHDPKDRFRVVGTPSVNSTGGRFPTFRERYSGNQSSNSTSTRHPGVIHLLNDPSRLSLIISDTLYTSRSMPPFVRWTWSLPMTSPCDQTAPEKILAGSTIPRKDPLPLAAGSGQPTLIFFAW